jgi:hypothetical protein
MKQERDLVAKDAREQLRRWDAGESIWSIEMGGFGPSYEQAIQVAAIEIVRDYIGRRLPRKGARFGSWGDDTLSRIDALDPITGKFSLGGLSGEQAGAAKFLAYGWLSVGPKAVHDNPKLQDRQIQVSNTWPHVASSKSRTPHKKKVETVKG